MVFASFVVLRVSRPAVFENGTHRFLVLGQALDRLAIPGAAGWLTPFR